MPVGTSPAHDDPVTRRVAAPSSSADAMPLRCWSRIVALMLCVTEPIAARIKP